MIVAINIFAQKKIFTTPIICIYCYCMQRNSIKEMPLHKFTNNFSLQYSVTQYTRSYKYMHTNISTIKKTAFKIYLLDHFWPAWILKNIYWGYRWGILNSIDRNSVLEYWNVGAAEKTCWIGTPFYSIWKYIEISNWFNDRTIYICFHFTRTGKLSQF